MVGLVSGTAAEILQTPVIDQLLKVEQVSELTGLGRTKLHYEEQAGRLKAVRIGRALRFPRSEVIAFIERAKAGL